MKKFAAAFLSLTLLFSIAGCEAKKEKKKRKDDSDETKKKQELTIEVEDGEKIPDNTFETSPVEQIPVDDPGDVTVEPVEMVNVSFKYNFDSKNTWQQENGYTFTRTTMMLESLEITDDRFPALKETVSRIENDKISKSNNFYNDLVADENNYTDYNGSSYNTVNVYRADTNVFSYIVYTNNYTYKNGSPEYESSFTGINIDSVTGEMIPLSDIVTDTDGFTQAVISILLTDFSNRTIKANAVATFNTMLTNDEVAVALLPDGVHISFDPENLLENTYTSLDFKVPYAGNESCINSKYFSSLPDSYILEFPKSGSMEWDINNDGTPEKIDIFAVGGEWDYNYFGVRINDSIEAGTDNWGLGYKGYLVNNNGKYYVYMIGVEENDYCYLMVFDIDANSVSYVGQMNSARPAILLDPSCMTFSCKIDCLSTMAGYMNYTIGANGIPEKTDNYYTLGDSVNLTTKVSLTGQVVNPDTMEPGSDSVTIEPGTILHYISTDDNSYVNFMVTNGSAAGTILRFDVNLEWGNGGQKINGISCNDAFTGTMYAG